MARGLSSRSPRPPRVCDTAEGTMLFGEFDWNRVLIAAGIGGAIGLVVYLVKKLTGAGRD